MSINEEELKENGDITKNENNNENEIKTSKKGCKFLMKKSFNVLFINKNYLNSNYSINNLIIFFSIIALLWLFVYFSLSPLKISKVSNNSTNVTVFETVAENTALPGGFFYSIWILFTFGHIIGYLLSKIRLPGLLGMTFIFKTIIMVKLLLFQKECY